MMALETIQDLMTNSKSEKVRLEASKFILRYLDDVSEEVDTSIQDTQEFLRSVLQ